MGITKRKEGIRISENEQDKGIKHVDTFKCSGSILLDKVDCDKEIKIRKAQGKAAFGKMRKLLINISMSMSPKLRLMKCQVWSTLLYGSETQTMKKDMISRMEASEMWILRRIIKFL